MELRASASATSLALALSLLGGLITPRPCQALEPVVAAPAPVTSTDATSTDRGPPSQALLLRWQPLRPDLSHPIWRRSDLRAVHAAWSRGAAKRACLQLTSALDDALSEASGLFYASSRKGAKLNAIERFWRRYGLGKAALLDVRAEVFVPSSEALAMVAASCGAARRWKDVERWTAHAALSGGRARRLRVAHVLARWVTSRQARALRPWISTGGSNVRLELIQAAVLQGAARARHLQRLRRRATARELGLIADVRRWLEHSQ